MDINYPNEGMPKLPPIKPGPWIIPVLLIALLLSSVRTIFYQVGPDEVGVVQQFGKFVRLSDPGLRFKLPFGIETVRRIKVTHVFKEEFGFRTVTAGTRTVYAGREGFYGENVRVNRQMRPGADDPFLEESLMLTGDLNMAIVEWIVQYTV